MAGKVRSEIESSKSVATETDAGDKVTVHISFKKGLPNYSSIEFGASVSITKRDDETDAGVWDRAWSIVEREIDKAVEKAEQALDG